MEIGTIIKPSIIGRGIRSYVVVATDRVRRINVTSGLAYGQKMTMEDAGILQGYSIIGRLEHGLACNDSTVTHRTRNVDTPYGKFTHNV
jgi:hypothetical protein